MKADQSTTEFRFAGFLLNARHRRLFDPAGRPVALSARPFDLLHKLVENAGETLSREQLLEAIWPRLVVEEHSLTQAISVIRKALADTSNESHFIRTVPGRGYCFIAPVEVLVTREEQVTASGMTVALRQPRWLRLAFACTVLLCAVVAGAAFMPAMRGMQRDVPAASIPSPLGVSMIPRPASRIRNSVAVMPLSTLSSQDDALFADGLHEALTAQLAEISGLHVMARASVLALLEQELSTLDATRILRVESILAGTLRLSDDEARISLQLVDVQSGMTLWSETYDADRHDSAGMLAVQDDIAANVASALRARMPSGAHADFAALAPAELAARRYNLAARMAHSNQDYAKAWRLARKALDADPDFYDALYSFTSVNVVLITQPLPGMTGREHAELALAHAQSMIDLAPERSEGHALKARLLAARRDWAGAAASIAALREMDAPLASMEYLAPVLLALGEFEQALAIYEASLASELVNPYARGFLMTALELSGRRDEARRAYALGQELHGQWWGDAVNVLLALGRNEPNDAAVQLVGLGPGLQQLLFEPQDREQLRAAIEDYRARPVQLPFEARYYAALAAQIGEHDWAVELLRTSLRDGGSRIFWVWLPVFDETRQQPGFRALLRESGLVAYWQAHGWPRTCQPVGETDFSCAWRAYPAEEGQGSGTIASAR